MPHPGIRGSARRRPGRQQTTELGNVAEGHIAELCRDLAVQTKRVRQLQEQAEDLRTVIRQWADHSENGPPLIVEDDAEK